MLQRLAKDPEFAEIILANLQYAPYGIFTFKSLRNEQGEIYDFECVFMNPKAEEITKIPRDEMVGATLLQKMPGNKEAGLFDHYCAVVETGEKKVIKQFYEGEHFNNWFEIHAFKMDDGFTVNFLDVTAYENALGEIEVADSRYRQLFHESIDCIFITNNELLFIDANNSMVKTFGFEREKFRNLSLKDLFKNEDDFIRFNREFYKNDRVIDFEAELELACGNIAICLINIVELSHTEDGIHMFQGIIRDISQKKRAERELLWAEKLSMTGKIARTIAHEVRNPLTNLSLALDQLREEIPPEVEDSELYMDIIDRNAKRIGNLITELLESSKPKSLRLERLSLKDQVQTTLKLILDRLKLQKMELVEDYDEKLPLISMDSAQMNIALLNLFLNAIEAMKPTEGRLTIKTSVLENQAFLEVSDNGKGIPKDDMDNLFEPFFTAKKGGMGLGLTTVQNIVKSHTGRIWAESELGTGTTFKILLPFN